MVNWSGTLQISAQPIKATRKLSHSGASNQFPWQCPSHGQSLGFLSPKSTTDNHQGKAQGQSQYKRPTCAQRVHCWTRQQQYGDRTANRENCRRWHHSSYETLLCHTCQLCKSLFKHGRLARIEDAPRRNWLVQVNIASTMPHGLFTQ